MAKREAEGWWGKDLGPFSGFRSHVSGPEGDNYPTGYNLYSHMNSQVYWISHVRKEKKWGRKEKEGKQKGEMEEEQQCKKYLTSTHYVTHVMLDMTYSPSINPHKMPWGSMVFIFILQIHKVRLSYVKTFADIVTARNWQSQDLNLDLFMFSLNYPACHL